MKPSITLYTPVPPERTGVAHYASMLIPALGTRVYQLGNNPHHEWIYKEAMANPGVIVLHDLVLHHLIVEMTLARGDVEGYVNALRANHGDAGAASGKGWRARSRVTSGAFRSKRSSKLTNHGLCR